MNKLILSFLMIVIILFDMFKYVKLQEKIYQTYLTYDELKDVYVTEKDLNDNKIFKDALEQVEDLAKVEKDTACSYLVTEYFSVNKKTFKDMIEKHSTYGKEKLFNAIYSYLYKGCLDKIDEKGVKYILNSDNTGKIVNNKTKAFASFTEDQISQLNLNNQVDEEINDYLSLSNNINKESNEKSNNERSLFSDWQPFIIVLTVVSVLIIILRKINFSLDNYENKVKKNNINIKSSKSKTS